MAPGATIRDLSWVASLDGRTVSRLFRSVKSIKRLLQVALIPLLSINHLGIRQSASTIDIPKLVVASQISLDRVASRSSRYRT